MKPVWCLVILLSSFCLRKYTNTSTIFNFKEFLKVAIKFWKVHNPVAKGTVYVSSMLYSRHKKSQVGHITQVQELTELLWNRGRAVIKFQFVASLLQVVSTLCIMCLINSWDRGEGLVINAYRSPHRKAECLTYSPLLSGLWLLFITRGQHNTDDTRLGQVLLFIGRVLPPLMQNEFKEQEDTISIRLGKRCNP